MKTPTPVKPKQAPKPPTPVFKCKKCHESFKTNSQLEGHKCWAECDKCSKTFTTKLKSEKHKLEEHTFRCSKCRQVLDSKENLGAHMDTEHSHFCDKCGSVFDNKVLLASHVAKEHSYKCGYCTKLLDSEEAVLVCSHKFILFCANVIQSVRSTKKMSMPIVRCARMNSHGWRSHMLATSPRTGLQKIL